MISFLDSLTLARTKLRTKKLLLVTTIAVAASVFGIIITSMIVVIGASHSADSYLKAALDGKYLVAVNPIIPGEVQGYGSVTDTPSAALKAHLLDLQKQYVTEQKELAKRYDVTFDSKFIDPILKPSPFGRKDALGNIPEVINRDSPVYQTYVLELQKEWLKTTHSTLSHLKELAETDGATAYYQNFYAATHYMNTSYMPGGKEDLSKVAQSAPEGYDPYSSSVQNSAYTFTDQSLVSRYILPENNKRQENKSALPVVITRQEATKLFSKQLGLLKEPGDASGKIAWMKELQEKINGLTYQSCYRSPAEIALIQQTMRENQSVASKGASAGMLASSITYMLPTSACTPVTIKKDSRTAAEKRTDANLESYRKAAGTYQRRATQLLTFQVVGVMSPTSGTAQGYNDVPSLINGLLGAQYQSGAFIPNQLYGQLPADKQHKDILQSVDGTLGVSNERLTDAGVTSAIVSFLTAGDAKKFIDTNTCFTMDQSGCNRPWTSQLYGVNYLLTKDINKKVTDVARLALPVALAVAVIVMSFTMARVIIDSRHETAIFRALGAKRFDIMRIYIAYSLMVAMLVVALSFAIGAAGAIAVEMVYGPEVTDYAKVAYGVFDGLGSFSLIGVNGVLLGLVVIAIFAVGIIAILPPLVRNVRRNPIRDMRDDG